MFLYIFHDQVEETVIFGNSGEFSGEGPKMKANDILQECDCLHDDVLPNVGVRLEDSNKGDCKVKLVNNEELLKEKEIRNLKTS